MSTALAVIEPSSAPAVLMPLVDPQKAKASIVAYEALKRAIIQPSDIQHIQGRDFLKKSFWRRIARCFGLSVELVREERLEIDGRVAYRVVYRAMAPNGQSMDGDGMMVYGEKGQTVEHNIRAIAHTRAKNRAISDLVGGGEVSAEEMQDEDEHRAPAPRRAAPAPRQAAREGFEPNTFADDPKMDPWTEVRELARELNLTDEDRAAIFAKHKKNRDAILKDLRARKAAQDDAAVVFEAVPADEPAAQDNGDADLLKHHPALKGPALQ